MAALDKIQQGDRQAERERIEHEGGDREVEAIEAFVKTAPTTAAGAAALVAYFLDRDAVDGYISGFTFENDETGENEDAAILLLRSLATFLDGAAA
jgi:hypothetical protein